MKRISTSLFDTLRTASTQMVLGWKLVRKDGYTLGFTTSDEPFTYEGLEYEPSNAFSGMAVSSKTNLSVDNTNAAVLTSDKITGWDLQAGLWDGAAVEMFWLDPTAPNLGAVPIRGGTLGEVKIKQGSFEAELRSTFQKLQQPFGRFYTLECPAIFGDDDCKVATDCSTWQPNARYIAKAGADAGIGSYVKPAVQNGFWYQCISARGNEATISSTPSVSSLMTGADYSNALATYYELKGLSGASAYSKIAKTAQAIRDGSLVISSTSSAFEKWVSSLVSGTTGGMVSIEGETPFGESFYRETNTQSGTLENSASYVTPTKQGAVPKSAPDGVEPLSVTNISSTVVYALGYSGASEPNWPLVLGQTIVDNQLVWKCIRARRLRGSVTAVFSRSHFLDASRAEPLDWWRYGVLEWLTGDNAGMKMEVRAYSHTGGGSFALLETMPGRIMEGDQYEAVKGCGRTRVACKELGNLNNFRGFPDMPTEEKALATANITEHGVQKNSGGS